MIMLKNWDALESSSRFGLPGIEEYYKIKDKNQDHTPQQKENSFLFFSYPSVNTTTLDFTVWYSLRQKALKNQPNDINDNDKEIEITCQQKK